MITEMVHGTPQASRAFVISRSNIINVIMYFHVLLLCQVFILAPVFQSLYAVVPGAGQRYLLVLPLVVICAVHVPVFSRPSDLGLALVAITPVIPAFCYFTVHGGSFLYIFTVFLGFLAFAYCRRVPLKIVGSFEIRISSLLILLFFFLLIVIALALQNFRINSISEILLDIYGVRQSVTEANSSFLLNYIQTWAYSVVIPFLTVYFFLRGNWLMLCCMFGLLFLFFLMLTGKSIIINPFITLAIYMALAVGRGFSKLFLFIIGVVALSAAVYMWFENVWLVAVLVRRTLFVPAMLNHHYHELFSDIGFVYYSHSIMSFLSDYPFQQSYQTLVGNFVFGSSLAHANTGIFGTGYMHFGYLGVIGFPAVMGLLSSFADSRKISLYSPKFAATIIALPTSTIFTSADLFSGMLTNGYLVALLLLMVCGRVRQTTK